MFSQSFDSIKKSLDEVENLYETSEGREKTSILECVWGGNYEVFEVQRARMSELFEKMYAEKDSDNDPLLTNSLAAESTPRLPPTKFYRPVSTAPPWRFATTEQATTGRELQQPLPARIRSASRQANTASTWSWTEERAAVYHGTAWWHAGHAPGTSGFQSCGSY